MSGHPFNELDLDLDVDTEDARDDALSGEFTKESALARYNQAIDNLSHVYAFLADVDDCLNPVDVRRYARKSRGELTLFQQWCFLKKADRDSHLAEARLLASALRRELTQSRKDAESLGVNFIETHTDEGRRIASYAKLLATERRQNDKRLARLVKMREEVKARRALDRQNGSELFDRQLSAHDGDSPADSFLAALGGLQGVAGRADTTRRDVGGDGGEAPQHVQRSSVEP